MQSSACELHKAACSLNQQEISRMITWTLYIQKHVCIYVCICVCGHSLLVPDDFDLEIRGMLPCLVLASIVPCTRTGEPLCLCAFCWPYVGLVLISSGLVLASGPWRAMCLASKLAWLALPNLGEQLPCAIGEQCVSVRDRIMQDSSELSHV